MEKKQYITLSLIVAVIIIGGLALAFIPQKLKQAQVANTDTAAIGTPVIESDKPLAVSTAVHSKPSAVLNSKVSFSYPEKWRVCSDGNLSVLAENYEGECPPVATVAGETTFNFPPSHKGVVYTLRTLDMKKSNAAGCSTATECIAKVRTFTDISGLVQQTYNGRPAICFNFSGANGGGTMWQLFFTDTDFVSFIQYSGQTSCANNEHMDEILASVKLEQ